MPRRRGQITGQCQACRSPDRARAERACIAGGSVKGVARKFDIPYHALRRHMAMHVSDELKAEILAGSGLTRDRLEEAIHDQNLSLLDHYAIVRARLYAALDHAFSDSDRNNLALLAGRIHENLRDVARLTGEITRGPLLNVQNNILVNPDYTRAIALIVGAVGPYPEARLAVIAALRQIEQATMVAPAIGSPQRVIETSPDD